MKPINSFLTILICSLASTVLTAQIALGRMVFDNWNTDACDMTDTAVFTLDRPIRADRIEVWYRWHTHEGSIRYSLSMNGQTLRNGILIRSSCDPYQEKWCGAVDGFDFMLYPGTYTINTERPRICQNLGSGGNGFVKVYGSRR